MVHRIAEDPTKYDEHTHGLKLCDGMLLAAGKAYYVQIFFSHDPERNVVTLVRLGVMREDSGPH